MKGERRSTRRSRRTCSPFSRSTRSHSRTSPATSTKSLERSSSSTLHALTISSSVLPRSSEGVGAATAGPAAAVEPAAGAPGTDDEAAEVAGLAPPKVRAVEDAAAAAGAVDAGVAAGLAPKEKEGAAVAVTRHVKRSVSGEQSSASMRATYRLYPRRPCWPGASHQRETAWLRQRHDQARFCKRREAMPTHLQGSTQPESRPALRQTGTGRKLRAQTLPAWRQRGREWRQVLLRKGSKRQNAVQVQVRSKRMRAPEVAAVGAALAAGAPNSDGGAAEAAGFGAPKSEGAGAVITTGMVVSMRVRLACAASRRRRKHRTGSGRSGSSLGRLGTE